MKKLIYGLFVCLSFVMVSCDKSTEDPSFITYYVDFTMNGDEVFAVPVGTEFVDPGVTATEQGEDVTAKIETDDNINTDEVGVYYKDYYAVNKDGYAKAITRTVIVYNPAITTDISGTYVAGDGTQREVKNEDGSWKSPEAFTDGVITFKKVANGVFKVSDFLGGFYDQNKGYGAGYAMIGYVELKADNTLSIISGDVAAWGDSYESGSFTNAVYTPAATEGVVKWTIGYAGMRFTVALNSPVEE